MTENKNYFFISPPTKKKKTHTQKSSQNRSKCGLFFLKGFTVTFDKNIKNSRQNPFFKKSPYFLDSWGGGLKKHCQMFG